MFFIYNNFLSLLLQIIFSKADIEYFDITDSQTCRASLMEPAGNFSNSEGLFLKFFSLNRSGVCNVYSRWINFTIEENPHTGQGF